MSYAAITCFHFGKGTTITLYKRHYRSTYWRLFFYVKVCHDTRDVPKHVANYTTATLPLSGAWV